MAPSDFPMLPHGAPHSALQVAPKLAGADNYCQRVTRLRIAQTNGYCSTLVAALLQGTDKVIGGDFNVKLTALHVPCLQAEDAQRRERFPVEDNMGLARRMNADLSWDGSKLQSAQVGQLRAALPPGYTQVLCLPSLMQSELVSLFQSHARLLVRKLSADLYRHLRPVALVFSIKVILALPRRCAQ